MENENLEQTVRVRRRLSAEEKQGYIEDQASSGMSAAAYCREKGISYGNFRNWQSQRSKTQGTVLRSIQIVGNDRVQGAVAEVRFVQGQVLMVQAGCSEALAVALTKALL